MSLRVLLALVGLCAAIAPGSRRGTWRAQWRAELWHYDQWLSRTADLSGAQRAWRLLARASGCLPHAIFLRMNDWSLHTMTHDLKFAWRMLVRRPAFTLVAVLILALGIGANATIFSWVNATLLNPLTGVDARGLVDVTTPSRT